MYSATFRPRKSVSIHAPHEGERRDCRQPSPRQLGVSIHAPHEGERHSLLRVLQGYGWRFNPRSPRGGATLRAWRCFSRRYVSIHAPHEGERRLRQHAEAARSMFQSTLPTRGSDIKTAIALKAQGVFQSTLPTRGSDPDDAQKLMFGVTVSIHAPHEGERLILLRDGQVFRGVSIHAPHEGERHSDHAVLLSFKKSFNPRSPRGGATLHPS